MIGGVTTDRDGEMYYREGTRKRGRHTRYNDGEIKNRERGGGAKVRAKEVEIKVGRKRMDGSRWSDDE